MPFSFLKKKHPSWMFFVRSTVSTLPLFSSVVLEKSSKKLNKTRIITVMDRKKWSKKEDLLLRKFYPISSKDKMIELLPNRTWASISIRASRRGFRLGRLSSQKSDVNRLLDDSNGAYYWIGFLLADGSFGRKRIKLSLSTIDEEHLCQFADFVSFAREDIGRYSSSVSMSAQDAKVVPMIKKKFDIKIRKTYNPPDLQSYQKMPPDRFIALLTGFIDGDGSIKKQHNRRDAIIAIKVHSSWLPWLIFASEKLDSIVGISTCSPFLNRYGYAEWTICDSRLLSFLKTHASRMGLPLMQRKWQKIDADFISSRRAAEERKLRVLSLAEEGLRPIDISSQTGIKYSTVYQIIKRNKASTANNI